MRIVHLSDLHCGNDYVLRGVRERRSWRNVFSLGAARKLKERIDDIRPEVVVITGDFVNKPSLKNFGEAIRVIKDLFSPLKNFDIRNRLLIVPGNHDIPWAQRIRNPFCRSELYRCFVSEVLDVPLPLVRLSYWKLFPDYRLCFVALDSTRVEGKDLAARLSIADGEIGNDQLRWLNETMDFFENTVQDFGSYYRIVLLHHHPYPIEEAPPDRNQQLCDMGNLQGLLWRREIHLVLHGHRHWPHFTEHPNKYKLPKQIFVCGAGTATCAIEKEQCGFGNNFNLITFMDDGRIDDKLIQLSGGCANGNSRGSKEGHKS